MTSYKVGMSLHDANKYFSMSKMTVVDESGNNIKQHYAIKLPEFIEFIARSAAHMYGGPENLP